LQIYTGLIYSITISLIGLIVKNLTNKYYGLLAIISLFLIYPIPLKPWPIYNCYFFYTLSLFFYIKDNKKYKLFSGFCLSLAYLSFTTVYNFVLPLLFFLLIFYYLVFLKKNKNELFKLFYFLVGSFVPILIFYIYLIINNIFGTWFTYQKIPILFELTIANKNIFSQILFFLDQISFSAFKNYIILPHQIYFGLIFFITLYFLGKSLYLKILEKKNNKKFDILIIISIFVISITPHGQIGGIEKMSTSLSIGIIILFVIINNLKSLEYKYFVLSFLLFTTILIAINNYNHPEYSSFKVDSSNKTYNPEKIDFFQKQKWRMKDWNAINGIIQSADKIKTKCNIRKAANLTADGLFFSIIENKIQIIPHFFKGHGSIVRDIIEPNLIFEIQERINQNDIYLISSENNRKLFNIYNYSIFKKFDISKTNLKLRNV